jgi:hypothetical protein
MLLNFKQYSLNSNEMIEATVDFVPLIFTAFLGYLGMDLLNSVLVTSFIGSVLVIWVSYLIVLRSSNNRILAFISALIIAIYPNVIFMGLSGFSAILFSGWALLSYYLIIIEKKIPTGLIVLSTLTLFRVEGFLYTILFFLAFQNHITEKDNSSNKRLIEFFKIIVCLSIPFLISCILRYKFYGYILPVPVLFKNTNFDPNYLIIGFKSLNKILTIHHIYLIFFLNTIFTSYNRLLNPNENLKNISFNLYKLNLLAFVFIVPYFVGGGDWFPEVWNRYSVILCIISVLNLLVQSYLFYSLVNFYKLKMLITLLLFILISQYAYINYLNKSVDIFSITLERLAFTKGRQSFEENGVWGWGRIDRFSTLGGILDQILPKNAIVSSGEEATIMYYSKRNMLGLLGVSNPDIIKMPLQEFPGGDPILYKRRGYESVYLSRPDLFAFNDPDVLGNFTDGLNLIPQIKNTLQNDLFQQHYVNTAYYRAGSYAALEKMGYKNVTLSFSDRLINLFISEKIYKEVIQNLEKIGFINIDSSIIHYSISPGLSTTLLPASKGIIPKLE